LGVLPGWRHLNDQLTALFETRRVRRYGGISFETKRSMGGSIATFFQKSLKLIKINEFIVFANHV